MIATPEYNSSVPAQLKSVLDWASRPYPSNVLRAKPVTVIGASTGIFGAVWAQAEVRKVLLAVGAHDCSEMTAEVWSGGVREWLEGDLVAEAFELADGAAACVVGVALGDDRGALVAVSRRRRR